MSGGDRAILEVGGSFGSYRVDRLLGKGGSGEVYLVTDPSAGSSLSVKILDPEVAAADHAYEERFVREAEFALRSRHPNIVAVYDCGRDPDTGLAYIVMDYCSGGTLRDRLERAKGGLPVPEACTIAADIAHALAYVQANGLVHRDVKPENVLFSSDGIARLADLGASRVQDRSDSPRVTSARAVIGTPAYMAPEQMLDSRSASIQSDLYSLGVVLFEMLAGRRPNDGETAMNTFAKALEGRTFPDIRLFRGDIPPRLASLVASLLSPAAEDRPSSARDVLVDLMQIYRAPTAQESAPRPSANRGVSQERRDPGVFFAAMALMASLAILAFIVFRSMRGGG